MRNILSLIGEKVIFVFGFIIVFIAIVFLNTIFSIIDFLVPFNKNEI